MVTMATTPSNSSKHSILLATTRSSRFIQVTYSFFNESNELDGCNVTYVWSVGQVLFLYPPTIFKYTSLYFNYPNNNLEFLYIQLPYECRGLVNSSSGGECSCPDISSILKVLTQQVCKIASSMLHIASVGIMLQWNFKITESSYLSVHCREAKLVYFYARG